MNSRMKAIIIESSLNQNEDINIEQGFTIQKEATLELNNLYSNNIINKSNINIKSNKNNLKLNPISIVNDSIENG